MCFKPVGYWISGHIPAGYRRSGQLSGLILNFKCDQIPDIRSFPYFENKTVTVYDSRSDTGYLAIYLPDTGYQDTYPAGY